MASPDPAPAPARADAVRSRAQILATAVSVLAQEPTAPMERVAATAGVHRATVYRHFPTRQALVDAVLGRALAEGEAIVEQVSALEPGPEALRALAEASVRFGQQYSFLIGTPERSAAGGDPIGLTALMARWQQAGVLDGSVSAAWLAVSYNALAEAIFLPGAVADGSTRAEVLWRSFLHGARAT